MEVLSKRLIQTVLTALVLLVPGFGFGQINPNPTISPALPDAMQHSFDLYQTQLALPPTNLPPLPVGGSRFPVTPYQDPYSSSTALPELFSLPYPYTAAIPTNPNAPPVVPSPVVPNPMVITPNIVTPPVPNLPNLPASPGTIYPETSPLQMQLPGIQVIR